MKKFVSVLMAIVMLITCGAVNVFAASDGYSCSTYEECTEGGAEVYIIKKDNCAIRTEPNNDGSIVARGTAGQLISVTDVFWTSRLTRWAEINVIGSDEVLYCYIENIEAHDRHAFARVLETDRGYMDFCTVCGYSVATADGDTRSCNLACVADQAVLGSLSEYDPSFWGVVSQMIVGELPGVGTIADARDLIGDILNGESLGVIALDSAALIPVVGALKYADELAFVAKNGDKAVAATNNVKYLPWGTWNDYDKVTRGGKEYVKLGDYYYTGHAVDEFTPAYIKSNKIGGVEHSRGISPTYVNWMITEGVAEGVTKVSAANQGRKMYENGVFQVIVEDDVVVTIKRLDSKFKK